jgi:hypothetical protein
LKRSLDIAVIVLVIAACFFSAMIASCGKKGDPVPRHQPELQMINNVRGEIAKDGIFLSWTLPVKTKDIRKFRILRWAAIPGEDCPGCPQNFVLLTEIDEASLQSGEKEPGKYQYLDRYVEKGRNYGYRIVWCVSTGRCSPESNTAEIKIK